MEIYVKLRGGQYFVELFVNGENFDECGPFDDVGDAEFAGERALRLGGAL